jgi:catechol-2,3-dioxygenase
MIQGCITTPIAAAILKRPASSTRTFWGCRSPGRRSTTQTGRQANVLHTFYEMGDGSFLAFFEAPDQPFEFKQRHDFDLHIALEVDRATLEDMFARGKAAGIETRGVSHHGFIDSIYFRDPNGYVIELTAKRPNHDELMAPARNGARRKLDAWQSRKGAASRRVDLIPKPTSA